MVRSSSFFFLVVSTTLLGGIWACGDDGPVTPPIDEVLYGETTFVVVVNPVVNDGNEVTMATPGTARSGITVAVDGGPSGTTDANGTVVLAPISPGLRTLTLSGSGATGDVNVQIGDGDLREVAIAADGTGSVVMADVEFAFGGQVIEVTPSMTLTEVNDALSQSNSVIFFRSGTYTGDLQFAGSNVTLFGQGARGGVVTLEGNVTVDGSGNRLRGAVVTGDLSVPGSNAGISFSRIAGALDMAGSTGTLMANGLCSTTNIAGSGTRLLDNSGVAPLPAPSGC